MATVTYEAEAPLRKSGYIEDLKTGQGRETDIAMGRIGSSTAGQLERQQRSAAERGVLGSGADKQMQARALEAGELAKAGAGANIATDFARMRGGAEQFDASHGLAEKGFQESARSNLSREDLARQGQLAGQQQWQAEFQQRQAEALNQQKMAMEQMKMQQQQALMTAQRSSPNYGTYQTGGYFGQPKQASGAAASYPTYQAPSQPIQTAPKPTATLGFSRTTTRPTTGLGWG